MSWSCTQAARTLAGLLHAGIVPPVEVACMLDALLDRASTVGQRHCLCYEIAMRTLQNTLLPGDCADTWCHCPGTGSPCKLPLTVRKSGSCARLKQAAVVCCSMWSAAGGSSAPAADVLTACMSNDGKSKACPDFLSWLQNACDASPCLQACSS